MGDTKSASAAAAAGAKERSDGRTQPNQLRAMSAECGLLNRADGSVRYSQGKTSLLVAVYGPQQASAKQEKADRASVEVIFKAVSGSATNAETERGLIVRQTVEGMVLTSLHPRTVISVVIQVVRDDGCLLAAALNATCLALLDAGIPCRWLVSAVSVGVGAAANGSPLSLDPDQDEEKAATATVTLAFSSKPELGMVTSETRGVASEDAYLSCLDAGEKACASIQSFFRLSLEKKLKPKA